MQDLRALSRSESLPIELFELDVTDAGSIARGVAAVIARFGHIDVLINNAGYGLFAFFEHATPEEVRAQFDTNVFGLVQVTQAVLPHMRKAGKGHIINISSAAAGGVTPMMGFYAASKWAVEALSEAMYFELKRAGITISVIEPGPFHTAFGASAHRNPKTDMVERIAAKKKRLQDHFIKDPQEVSALVVRVVKSAHPKFRYPAGISAKMIFLLRKILPGSWFLALEGLLLRANARHQEKSE